MNVSKHNQLGTATGKGRDTGVVRQTREAFTAAPSEMQKASLMDETGQEEVPSPSLWAQD